ncbi:MAG: DUF362 domain-containing protein [Deltaproteobacteria bacterium]|nr:DUF362 domain-containing protein [Deltaproteobacteria bacterium]
MNDYPLNRVWSRREFVVRSAKAGAILAASGLLGYGFYDSIGPGPDESPDKSSVLLPDFSIPAAGRKMAIATGDNRVQTINLALKALGGVESFIRKGDRVLVKVNAAFATPAIVSATTNPELLKELIRLCYSAGASSVVVTDNPINDPGSCFALTGIGEAARSGGARLILPREGFFRETTVPGAAHLVRWPLLYEPFHGINKLIGVAPVKDHHRSGASMTMKNWYGLLGGRRNIFHQDIHNLIKELAMMVKPTLVVLDGTTTMMTNGPTGGSLSDLKQTNVMIVSTDQVAADALGATLLGRSLHDLPFIAMAEAAGAGSCDLETIRLERVSS